MRLLQGQEWFTADFVTESLLQGRWGSWATKQFEKEWAEEVWFRAASGESRCYFRLAYSAFACFSNGRLESASFQRERKT